MTADLRAGDGTALSGRPVTWSSSDPAIATVSTQGGVSALTVGSTTISATAEGKTGSAQVVVAHPPATAVVVLPATLSIQPGQTGQFTAEARNSAGTAIPGKTFAWVSGNPLVATVSQTGQVSALMPGTSIITASVDAKIGSATLTVVPGPVATVEVAPAASVVEVTKAVQLVATAKDAGGFPVPDQPVAWVSSAPSIASVSNSGLVTGVVPGGPVTVTAAVAGKTGASSITVVPGPVADLSGTYTLVSYKIGAAPALVPPVAIGTLVLTSTRYTITASIGGQPINDNGTYTVSGNQITQNSDVAPIQTVGTWSRSGSQLTIDVTVPVQGRIISTWRVPADGSDIEHTTFDPSLGIDLTTFTKSATGLYFKELVVGAGTLAQDGQQVGVRYKGQLPNAFVFDENPPPKPVFAFLLGAGAVVPGFDQGTRGMRIGGKRQLIIPPALGYGSRGSGSVPANSIMVFTVDLVSVTPPLPAGANCSAPATLTLSVGQYQVVSPAASLGCVRLPGAAAESEYLVALVSGAGQVTESGVSGPFALRANAAGSMAGTAAAVTAVASLSAEPRTPSWPERFHLALRESEARLAADPGNRLPATLSPGIVTAPDVGSERLFRVCKNLTCTQFDSVTAVARSVREKVAVYLDKVVPTTDSLRQEDLDELARTFETYHYPINSNAFGGESDQDGNGLVIILMTDAVNALTPDCTNGRILGYFWGGDLLNITGSNSAEVFYAMVPAPATSTCTAASGKQVVDRIKPTLIHEYQHMISFNQHVLVRGGSSETVWLNEALSHLSEELAGKLIPNSECAGFTSCRSQYSSGNIFNAWDYLEDTESIFLVAPGTSNGTLEERGAGWLFVRWLADQFGTDPLGTNVTRALVQTSQVGAQNVYTVASTEVASTDFPTLVGEWLLATYVDDLAGFTPASPRITYTSWGFRKVFQDNCCISGAAFPRPFPTAPVLVSSAGFPFARSGTLRGGSGRHFSVTVGAGSQGIDLLLAQEVNGPAIDPALASRFAVVRLR